MVSSPPLTRIHLPLAKPTTRKRPKLVRARSRVGGNFTSNRVEDDIGATTVGRGQDPVPDRSGRAIDHRIRPEVPAERGLLRADGDGENPRTERPSELDGCRTGPARTAQHDEGFALLEPSPLDEGRPRGRVADPKGRCHRRRHLIGDSKGGAGGQDGLLGEPTAAIDKGGDPHDPGVDRDLDCIPDGIDHSAHLLAADERQGRCERISAATHENVRQTDRRRLDAHAQFTCPRCGRIDLDTAQYLARFPVLVHLPGSHHTPPPTTSRGRTQPLGAEPITGSGHGRKHRVGCEQSGCIP